jgi:hypothetical protein
MYNERMSETSYWYSYTDVKTGNGCQPRLLSPNEAADMNHNLYLNRSDNRYLPAVVA